MALGELYRVELMPGIRDVDAPEESGSTFEENAALKAAYYSRLCREPVFADDSGLEVDALGGRPGVHSARYAGPGATSADNNRLLLEQMRGVRERSARFVCVIALARGGEVVRSFRGTVEGELLEAPRGTGGFGYDPLFLYPPFGCTFGEASREEKTGISARGKALAKMVEYLLFRRDA